MRSAWEGQEDEGDCLDNSLQVQVTLPIRIGQRAIGGVFPVYSTQWTTTHFFFPAIPPLCSPFLAAFLLVLLPIHGRSPVSPPLHPPPPLSLLSSAAGNQFTVRLRTPRGSYLSCDGDGRLHATGLTATPASLLKVLRSRVTLPDAHYSD